MKKICLIFLLIWCTGTSAISQGEWTAYTATGEISKIIRHGNTLWMAATGGLVKWNLADNTYIKYTTLDGLPYLYLRDVVLDSAGTLWICSEGGGVTAFDGKNWTSFSEPEGLPSDDVFCAEIDRQGNKWFGTMEGVVKYDGNNWVTFQKNEEPIKRHIFGLVLDKRNAIWVTSHSGLSTYQNSTWKFVDNIYARTLTVDQENNLWGAGFGYVWKYDGKQRESFSLGPLIEVYEVTNSAVDSSNIKWFGSETGLWRFDDSTVVHFTTEDGLTYNYVTDIYVDSLNNKWIGTSRGFSKFDGQSWTNYNLKKEIRSYYIPALAVDQNNRLWVSDYNFGVAVFDGISWQNYDHTHGLFDDCIKAIAPDRQNNLWFGAEYSRKISKFDGTTWTSFSTADGLIGNGITAIAADFDNTVWVGTTSGVCKYDGEMWQSCRNIPELGLDPIYEIAVDRLGCLWFASSTGLVKYDGNTWTKFNSENGLPSDYGVSSLSVDKSNNIWVITSGRVSMYDGSNWTHRQEQVIQFGVRDLAIDSSDVKWFCLGRHGIARFDGFTWTYFSQKEINWADDEIICVTVDAKNNKWFGTEAGGLLKYTEFPDKITPSPKPTNFTISGNYPNPFNAATQFEYTLPGQPAQPVEIKIFDVLGRQVNLLFHGMQPGGHYRISRDGTDANGNACVSGIYLVLFEVNRQRVLRKVSLIK